MPAQPLIQEESLLLNLPVELAVEVFASLPSFESATKLAATCHQLNQIWHQHFTTICSRIAYNTIPCYRALRSLLADQGHVPLNTTVLTLNNVIRIVDTANMAQDLVDAYEEQHTANTRADPQVSPVLSPTEKIRFIRAHYQIWQLLRLKASEWQPRIAAMDLKQLCLLSDFLCIFDPDNIQDEILQQVMEKEPWVHRRLQHELRARRNTEFRRLHGRPYRPIKFTPYEQSGRYAWWCDRQQELFKKMVTGTLFHEGEEDGENIVEEDVWNDSGDDE